jgi:hypothetical protein
MYFEMDVRTVERPVEPLGDDLANAHQIADAATRDELWP